MKVEKRLKIALIVLLIILVSIISFAGIFVQNKNKMTNLVADYQWGMDLKGARVITIATNQSKNTVYYDKDGKVVEKEAEGGSKKEVPVNEESVLNKDNYLKTKDIIIKRLDTLGVSEYFIRQDEETGKITVQLSEDSLTDLAVQYMNTTGSLTIEDEDGNVLLDNSNIENAKVAYNTGTTGMVTVFINIQFKEDAIEKLKEISNTYVTTSDENGKDTSKKVTIKLDDSTLLSTSFSEEIANGVLSLSIGSASSSNSELNTYLQEASNLAILINNGKLPIVYEVEQNRYVNSDITLTDIITVGIIIGVIVLIGLIVLGIKYKKNGILTAISYIGYTAVLLIVLRYANVVITTEGIFGIVISLILNYVFSVYLLNTLKKEEKENGNSKKAYNKTMLAMLLISVPSLIIGITLCFTSWLPMYSFGTIIFWGVLLVFVYNTIVTRTLVLESTKN